MSREARNLCMPNLTRGFTVVALADEERDWIQRSREGDAQAYRHLVERYQARIHRLVSSLLGYGHGNIEDVVQEVFVKAYFSLKRFRGDASFGTWIYRIAINQTRDEIKKTSRNLSLEASLSEATMRALQDLWTQSADEEDHDRSPSEGLQQFVSQTITALPEKLRSVVTLKDLEGLSYQEVSQVLRCSLGTVKSRHSRARAKLRTLLAPYLPDLQT